MGRSVLTWPPLALLLAFPLPGNAQEDWRLYEFRANERFRYEFEHTENGETTAGSYVLEVEPAGGDRLRITVAGKMGDAECSGSATAESSETFPVQLLMACATVAPVAMAFAMPTWGWFMGRTWEEGDEWSMSQGGESLSFRVERSCSHAGQQGRLAVMRQNGEVRLQSCVARHMALPLAVMIKDDDGDSIKLELVEYRG